MVCKYVCRNCWYEFEREKPGPTECPKCKELYVDWINYEEVLQEIKEQG